MSRKILILGIIGIIFIVGTAIQLYDKIVVFVRALIK